jgi:hypothetical protein
MQMLRPFNIDKIHRTFDDVFADQKTFVNGCQNVNKGIADRQRIKAYAFDICEIYWGHAKFNSCAKRQ